MAAEPITAAITVAELTETAGKAHLLTVQSAAATLAHAITAGEALIQIKSRVDGSWAQWCARHLEPQFGLTYETSFTYMRLARHKDDIPDGMGIGRAVDWLATVAPGQSKYDPEVRHEAHRRLKKGASPREVSEALGVPVSTVSSWRYAPSRSEREKRARWALQRRETKAAADKLRLNGESKASKGVGRAYQQIRLLLGALDDAGHAYGSPEVSALIDEAYALASKCEDLIGKAVRLT